MVMWLISHVSLSLSGMFSCYFQSAAATWRLYSLIHSLYACHFRRLQWLHPPLPHTSQTDDGWRTDDHSSTSLFLASFTIMRICTIFGCRWTSKSTVVMSRCPLITWTACKGIWLWLTTDLKGADSTRTPSHGGLQLGGAEILEAHALCVVSICQRIPSRICWSRLLRGMPRIVS